MRDILAQAGHWMEIVCFPSRWICLHLVLQRAKGPVCAQSLGLMAGEPACKVIPMGLIPFCPAPPLTWNKTGMWLLFLKMNECCCKEGLLLSSVT